jgi:hypothetical protein
MSKLILLSVIMSAVTWPILASRARTPLRGLKWMMLSVFLFNCFYLGLVLVVHLRLNLKMNPANAMPEYFR